MNSFFPSDRPRRKWRFGLGALLQLQVAAAPLFLGVGIGIQARQNETAPVRQSGLWIGLFVIWVLPAFYAGVLSALSIPLVDWKQKSCANVHAMRGLVFGVLYAPLLFGGIMASQLGGATPVLDLGFVFVFTCFTAGYALFTGGEGWVVGALIGLARCRRSDAAGAPQ